jgi:hypothetical protein
MTSACAISALVAPSTMSASTSAWRGVRPPGAARVAARGPRGMRRTFKAFYGPTIATQANARRTDREGQFILALNRFFDDWNAGTPDDARFELEYLIAVGTRAG